MREWRLVDNLTHTLAGFALSAAGLSRRTRLATAALVLGSNLPDADLVTIAGGRLAFIDQHRGISHSLVGGCVLGVLLGISLWAIGRRLWRDRPARAEVRLAPLVSLALLAVGLHLAFDCLNDYGIRLFLPFLDRWSYGDIIFIIDPWFWLLLGGGVHLALRRGRKVEVFAWMGWTLVSLPVLLDSSPPMPAKLLWLLGLGALGALRYGLGRHRPRGRREAVVAGTPVAKDAAVWPRMSFALLAVYVVFMFVAHALARGTAEDAVNEWEGPHSRLAVIPRPADPFHWNLIYETPGQIVAGIVVPVPDGNDGVRMMRSFDKHLDDPRVRQALKTPAGRTAARFCRYLFADVVPDPDGAADVSFRDARFTVRDRHEFSVFTVRVER